MQERVDEQPSGKRQRAGTVTPGSSWNQLAEWLFTPSTRGIRLDGVRGGRQAWRRMWPPLRVMV